MEKGQVRYILIVLWLICSVAAYAFMAKGAPEDRKPSKIVAIVVGLLLSGVVYAILFPSFEDY